MQKNAEGEYVYNYGVILNYIFPVDKLMTLLDENMPLHAAKKKDSIYESEPGIRKSSRTKWL